MCCMHRRRRPLVLCRQDMLNAGIAMVVDLVITGITSHGIAAKR